MGIFKDIKNIWNSLDSHQRELSELHQRIKRLEYPPRFNNLQNVYFIRHQSCGKKPNKWKAVIIKSTMLHNSIYDYNSVPRYEYEVSIEGYDKTQIVDDNYLAPRNK